MRTRGKGATVIMVLLLAVAAGVTVLGGLGVLSGTAYAQGSKRVCGEECSGVESGGGVMCSVVGEGGCGCNCSGPAGTGYITQCVCGNPNCRLYSPDRTTCLY